VGGNSSAAMLGTILSHIRQQCARGFRVPNSTSGGRPVRAAAVTAAVLLVAASGYVVADAYDVVPGFVTVAPRDVPPAPFLTAAAVAPRPAPSTAVAPWNPDAPVPDAGVVQQLAQDLREDSRTGDSTNVIVVDALTGFVLADLGADNPQVPASATKVLTMLGAIANLGVDYRATTIVQWDGAGVLTLVAGGDMMLAAGNGHAGTGSDAMGWAGMGDLADQLAQTVGARQVQLRVDDALFPGDGFNDEWPQYAIDVGYVARVTGLAVEGARLDPTETYSERYDDPSLAAGEVLAAELEARGFTVSTVRRGTAPVDNTVAATVEGAPLSEVTEYVWRDSDNTIAEVVSLLNALGTGRAATADAASNATREGLRGLGLDDTDLQLFDGAGFSTKNRVTPRHLTDALAAAAAEPSTARVLEWLPVAALEGTLQNRFIDTPAAGFTRGKTGSLTGVTSLAGAVSTAEGRQLYFAALLDGMPAGQEIPRAALDEFVQALANCGCDGS
jgi:D-alanyl-D-alanine carboxypeptidase/D-alanyl-D-alanine-endopeptidase (penicillin-binding protein 4)